jgi:hypothetical protein
LTYFGYPQAHEDDRQRAIRAGLAIIAAVEALDKDFPERRMQLNVRIGINTGIGGRCRHRGAEQREKKAIVGDTPNIAARLQSLAELGTIVIGKRTYRLIEGLFVCEPLGVQHLKGISDPVDVFVVREDAEARSSFEAKLQRGLSPPAGRTEEVSLLVNRLGQAREGDGQVVLISGEPGVGKSRVFDSFRSVAAQENGPLITLVCSNYQQDIPFFPVIDYLERTIGEAAGDTQESHLDSLEEILRGLGLHSASNSALIAQLLNLPALGRFDTLNLTLEKQKNRTLRLLTALAVAAARQSPALIVFEDLQWADHSTLELFGLAPEVVYEFKHALVKDAAYQGLLHSKRRQLHREIAQVLETRFPQVTA